MASLRVSKTQNARLSLGAVIFLIGMLVPTEVVSAAQRSITVEDCVRTRRIVDQEVSISPDGSRVAYIVKTPDLKRNRNYYRLFVSDLQHTQKLRGRLLIRANGLSDLRWLGSGRIVVRVEGKLGKAGNTEVALDIVNVQTGTWKGLDLRYDILQFSASADGRRFVFSTNSRRDRDKGTESPNDEPAARGYPIAFGNGLRGSNDQLPEHTIYLATRTNTGTLRVRKLCFTGLGNAQKHPELRNVLRLDLSPDGKHLLIVFSARQLPTGWANEPYVRYAHGFETFFDTYVLGLYDVESGRFRLGFNFPAALLHTRWSGDGRSYCVVGPSPFGTDRAIAEEEIAAASGSLVYAMLRFQHVFTVDVQTGQVLRVINREGGEPGNVKFLQDLPLVWKQADGPMLIRAGDNSFAWMRVQRGQWEQIERFSVLNSDVYLSSLSSDGKLLVGVSQTAMIPPNLFTFNLGSKKALVLTDLNPEYRSIRIGEVQPLGWTNRYGSRCAGFLIKPVDYKPGQLYPMIFLAAPAASVFISDAPYTTAFAPQSLANAGFAVVMAQYPFDNKVPDGKFPGETKEAYNWLAMVESAVDLLVNEGVIDGRNIGIVGFSRTSWLTDFTLTHSSYNFVAASSADSGIYTYGAYFEYNDAERMRAAETEMGGPPYGDLLGYWLDNAPPFNAAKVRAAVLMEYTGTAESGQEFFTSMKRLGKVVELFRYPDGAHPLDTPFERVASLQRNLDWFRFWMQGFEGKSPQYDPTQYARWHLLREQQHWIDHMRVEGKDPSMEFLRQTSAPGPVASDELAPEAREFLH